MPKCKWLNCNYNTFPQKVFSYFSARIKRNHSTNFQITCWFHMDINGSVKRKSFSCNYRHKHTSERWSEWRSTAISLYRFYPHFLCEVMPCFKSVRESKSKRTLHHRNFSYIPKRISSVKSLCLTITET